MTERLAILLVLNVLAISSYAFFKGTVLSRWAESESAEQESLVAEVSRLRAEVDAMRLWTQTAPQQKENVLGHPAKRST